LPVTAHPGLWFEPCSGSHSGTKTGTDLALLIGLNRYADALLVGMYP